MPLRSMTGFGRSDGEVAGTRFHWELRSVNGRGLDVRLRLPPGHEALEAAVREAVGKSVSRGSITATLTLDTATAGGELRINERALATVLAAVERLRERDGFAKARPEGVLGLRGVLEVGETAALEGEASRRELLRSLDGALTALVEARRSEGARLEQVLSGQVATIASLVERIAALPSRQPHAVRERLAEQVARLMGTNAPLDPDRLHQEAVIVATRADVEEEIKRLDAHVAAARSLMAELQPVGRKLDFLAQELNREANTICSKSNDIEMTRLGLELKAVIDQVREQVQNIE
ncbi:MAG: YicC/YloC family endoribonuclease [Hyphomicrobiaceae bacterium]